MIIHSGRLPDSGGFNDFQTLDDAFSAFIRLSPLSDRPRSAASASRSDAAAFSRIAFQRPILALQPLQLNGKGRS